MIQRAQGSSFQTSDLALAITLSLWEPICSVNKSNPRRAIFFFNRTKKLDDLIKNYWDGKLNVEPQSFFHRLKLTKTRIYETE